MTFIEILDSDGVVAAINVDQISSIQKMADGRCMIRVAGASTGSEVNDSYENVISAIKRAKITVITVKDKPSSSGPMPVVFV